MRVEAASEWSISRACVKLAARCHCPSRPGTCGILLLPVNSGAHKFGRDRVVAKFANWFSPLSVSASVNDTEALRNVC